MLPFPSLQVDPYRGMTPHFRVAAARARALHAAATGTRAADRRVRGGAAAARQPAGAAAARVDRAPVGHRDRAAAISPICSSTPASRARIRSTSTAPSRIRGGIVDVFPAADAEPVRIEFVGDMVETLRRFDPGDAAVDRRRSIRSRSCPCASGSTTTTTADVASLDFFGALAACQLSWSPSSTQVERAGVTQVRDQLEASYARRRRRAATSRPLPPDAAFVVVGRHRGAATGSAAPRLEELARRRRRPDRRCRHGASACQPAMEFHGRVGDWIADVRQARERGDTVLFVADSPGRAERTVEILQEYDIVAVPVERAEDAHAAAVLVGVGALSRGFRLADAGLQIYAETDVFDEERRAPEKRRNLAKTFLSDLRDLKVGDLVVHVDHGIGEFVGLKQLGRARQPTTAQEFLELRYHGDDKLFVPVERLDLIQKYTGGTRPGARSARRHDVGEGQDARQEGDARHGRGAAEALRAAQGGARSRVRARHALAGGVRGRVSLRADARSGHRDRRHQARHGVADADGPPAVRRRRLRQDRGGDARGVQGGDGRQAGRRSWRRRRCSRSST